VITEYATANGLNAGSDPGAIVAGEDGNIWFTDHGATPAIGRVGTGAEAASQAAPAVTGGGQEGTPQICTAAQWASFASQQPLVSLFPFDGVQWLLNGTVVTGQTSATFTPTSAEVGDTLACSRTVTYTLGSVTAPSANDVTAVATSPAITVTAPTQSGTVTASPKSGTAPRENTSAEGSGPAGAPRATIEIELVTCRSAGRKRKCSARLSAASYTFTVKSATASVLLDRRLYATGSLNAEKLTLRASKPLHAGRYTLKLTTRAGRHAHATTKSVTLTVGRSGTLGIT
jgi:hypothetical protein